MKCIKMFKKIAMWNVNRKRNNDTPADTVQNNNNHDRDISHDCWFGSARFSLNFLEVKSSLCLYFFAATCPKAKFRKMFYSFKQIS